MVLAKARTFHAGESRKRQTLKEAREASSFRKKSKKRAFLRASELSLYIDDLRFGENSLEEEPAFASLSVDTHYNGRLARPYAAGSFSFAENAGLYVLLRLADEKDLPSVLALFHLLGLSGIGGRARAGWENLNSAQIPFSSPRAPRKRIPAPL